MLFLALFAVTAPFRFHVDAAELPNVVYHVGCLSGRTPCSKPQIEKFLTRYEALVAERGERAARANWGGMRQARYRSFTTT